VPILTQSENIKVEGDQDGYMWPVNFTVIEASFFFFLNSLCLSLFRGILSHCGAVREQQGY
jgi:hypothetical protein